MATPREPWPWERVERSLAEIKSSDRKPAVIFMSGSMSPTHRGHVSMLHQARQRLERLGFEVLGGWLSPCHDLAVLNDAAMRQIPELRHEFRVRLAELSVREDRFISVASWEGMQPRGATQEEVARSLCQAVNTKFKSHFVNDKVCEVVRVFCVMGCDAMERLKLHNGFSPAKVGSSVGMVIVPREGSELMLLDKPNSLFFVAETGGASITTAKLRHAIRSGDKDYIAEAMTAEAARAVLQPSAQDLQSMRINFENLGIVNPASEIIAKDGPWPLAKLLNRLAHIQPGVKPAVLIVSGAMSPTHHGHFEVMKSGRERLERAGYKVLAGFLSPQNAVGSAAEMRAAAGLGEATALSTAFRLKTAQLAVQDDDFVSLSPWEASITGKPPRPHEVMQDLTKFLYDNVPQLVKLRNDDDIHLRVFFACGPGQAGRRGLSQSLGSMHKGVVVVPRTNEECFLLEKPSNLFFVGDPAPGEANIEVAGQIRGAVRSGNATFVQNLVPKSVARFLLSPTPAEQAAMKTDFAILRPEAVQGSLRLTDPSAAREAAMKFKSILKAWEGTDGAIAIDDIARLLEALDPSWTNSELLTFSSGASVAVGTSGKISADELVDWLFGKS